MAPDFKDAFDIWEHIISYYSLAELGLVVSEKC